MQTRSEINKAIENKTATLHQIIDDILANEQASEEHCNKLRKEIEDLKKTTPFDDTLAGQIAVITEDRIMQIEALLDEFEQETGIKLKVTLTEQTDESESM